LDSQQWNAEMDAACNMYLVFSSGNILCLVCMNQGTSQLLRLCTRIPCKVLSLSAKPEMPWCELQKALEASSLERQVWLLFLRFARLLYSFTKLTLAGLMETVEKAGHDGVSLLHILASNAWQSACCARRTAQFSHL
jgi:hypothetical protein